MGFLKKHYFLISIIALSFITRVLFVNVFMDSSKYYWEDTIHYYSAAESIVKDGTFGIDPERVEKNLSFNIEPVYSIFLVPFVYFSSDSFLWIRLFQELLYVLSAIWVFLLLKMHMNTNFSLFGTFIYLFYPFYIYFGGVVLTEGIYTPLLVAYVYYSIKYLSTKKTSLFYYSVIVLAILGHVKVQTWSMGLATLIIFLYVNRKINLQFFKKAIICTSLFVLVCLPWGIRNYQLTGQISLPRNYGVNKGESEMEMRFKTKDNVYTNTINFFSPSLTGVDSRNKFTGGLYSIVSIVSVVPLILGMLLLPLFKRNKYIGILYIMLASYALPYIILFARTRFRVPIDFVMIMFLTLLIAELWNRVMLKKIKA